MKAGWPLFPSNTAANSESSLRRKNNNSFLHSVQSFPRFSNVERTKFKLIFCAKMEIDCVLDKLLHCGEAPDFQQHSDIPGTKLKCEYFKNTVTQRESEASDNPTVIYQQGRQCIILKHSNTLAIASLRDGLYVSCITLNCRGRTVNETAFLTYLRTSH